MSTYVLGIDNGGTISKAALYDLTGQEIAVTCRKTEMLMPKPGYTERDSTALWQANAQAISAVLQQSGIDAGDIAAVAITGHGNGLYLIDAHGSPVYPGINSADTRARAYVDRWYANGTFEAVFPKIMQSVWPGQPVALLAWLRDHQPDVLQRARWALMCKDYVRYCLTGEPYAEITDMSGTSLMNVRDVTYDDEVLRAFGLEAYAHLLPPLRSSADICGYVTADAAAITGLKAGTPVAGGLFDIDACGIATGMTTSDTLCIVGGSWSINQYISASPVVSASLFMTSIYCMPGYWLILEGSPTSASNLEWFVTEFLCEERKIAEQQCTSVYDVCNALVEQVPPEDAQIVFLPFLYGSHATSDAKAAFLGMTGWHTRAHVVRAIYEGIIFSHKTHIEKLLAFRAMPKTVRMAGGAAHSPVWMQMFADVLQLPIEVTAGTELGALGAAICAGVATQHFTSYEDAVGRMVRVAQTYTPDPALNDVYNTKYAAYQHAITALTPFWKNL